MNTLTAPEIIEQRAKDYHIHPAISKGKLSDFRDSHRMYHHKYVLGDAPPKAPSKKMDIGTLGHVALLEPERLDGAYAIFPRDVLAKNGAESTNAAADFRAEYEAAGRIVLKQGEFDTVSRMADSVRRKIGHWLKLPNRIEHSVYWTDPATGLECRCRPDWLIEQASEAFLFDFKTTDDASPGPFSRVAGNFDYPLQHSHYTDGVSIALEKPVEFYFVVVQTEFPWTCVLYELEPQDQQASFRLRTKLMTELAACQRHNDWSDSWEHDIRPLSLKPWHYE